MLKSKYRMSNFTEYYYRMKNGNTDGMERKLSPNEIIKIISKRWRLTIPKTNKEKNQNPLFTHICSLLEKTVLPIEVKTQSIVSFGRYRGFIFVVCYHPLYTDEKYNVLLFVDNQVKGNIILSPLTPFEREEASSDSELLNNFKIDATVLADRQTLFNYIDSYTQRILIDKADDFHIDDKFYFNKNAVIISLSKNATENLVDTVMSVLYNILETIQKYK